MKPKQRLDIALLAAAFSRRLEQSGIVCPIDSSVRVTKALTLLEPASTLELYWCLRIALVKDIDELPIFESVFYSIFGTTTEKSDNVSDAPYRTKPVTDDRSRISNSDQKSVDIKFPLAFTTTLGRDQAHSLDEDRLAIKQQVLASDKESVHDRPLNELSPEELELLDKVITETLRSLPQRFRRRYGKLGTRPTADMRRTIRQTVRSGGDPIKIYTRSRRKSERPIVGIVDVSGSMEQYVLPYIHFFSCLAKLHEVETFVFSTRLTRVTELVKLKVFEDVLARTYELAKDRFGGTKIGDALKTFTDLYGRRSLARGAIVIVISDGWESGDVEKLAEEMRRISLLSHKVIWVNPRAAAEGFQPLTRGMQAVLPYCNFIFSGHSIASLSELCTFLSTIP